MAILCRDAGLLFIQTPHTGSTAIGDVLVARLGGERLMHGSRKDAKGDPIPFKHGTLRRLMAAGLVSVEERARLVVAAGVRNPWDMLVTEFVRSTSGTQVRRDGTIVRREGAPDQFPTWLRWRFRPTLRQRLTGGRYAPVRDYLEGVDHIIRSERLQEDFDALLARLAVARIEVPLRNPTAGRSDGRHYSSYYGPDERRIVEAVYGDWIDRFGYGFEEVS